MHWLMRFHDIILFWLRRMLKLAYLFSYSKEKEFIEAKVREKAHALESWAKREKEYKNEMTLTKTTDAVISLENDISYLQSIGADSGDDIQWAKSILQKYKDDLISYTNKPLVRVRDPNKPVSILEIAKGRRSYRKWDKSKELDMAMVRESIDAARWAPTSCNRQTIKFIMVTTSESKRLVSLIRTGSESSKLFVDAAAVFLIIADDRCFGSKELYALPLDIGAAVQTFMLALWERGFGTCWTYYHNLDQSAENELRKRLGIPPYYRFYSTIAAGIPLDDPEPPLRKSIDQYMNIETFTEE